MRPAHDRAPLDGYPRPQQPWLCGLADDGPPCPLGPSAGGHCPAASACHPLRDGDRWTCNRSPLRGGPCTAGPAPDGLCPVVHRCTPMRSLRTKRRNVVVGVTVAALGAAVMLLSGSWRNRLVAPGALSSHHAQLIAGAHPELGCSKCHAAGGATLVAWREQVVGGPSLAPTQTSLCLACHDKSIGSSVALAAHTMPLEALNQLAGPATDQARVPRRDPAQPIACAACHREHQGPAHQLAAVSDLACQACHRARFASFAEGHPEFDDWPYERPTRIAFDHATHLARHFPAAEREFACAACHASDSTGQRQTTFDYATGCASCHDKSLRSSLTDGLPLVSLPTLDVDALRQAGHDVGPWPEAASGDFDGALPMPLRLLIAADPRGAAALSKLGPEFDFFDVDPDAADPLAAAADIAAVLREVVADLATRGQPAMVERLQQITLRELSAAEGDALAARFPADLITKLNEQWLQAPAAAPPPAEPPSAAAPGAWRRDDQNFSLRYQPTGHDDPWLRAWLDVLAAASSGPQAALAEPLLRSALKPTAPGQCGSCHRLEQDAAGRFTIQWRSLANDHVLPSLTHFSHGPHVLQAGLRDCASCHRVTTGETATAAASQPQQHVADFAPMSKSACVACHTPTTAGDRCTQCHQYHSGRRP